MTLLKGPGEEREFGKDFTDTMTADADEIDTATWVKISGTVEIIPGSDEVQDAIAYVWLTGGTAGTLSVFEVTVVTTGERTHVRRLHIQVEIDA